MNIREQTKEFITVMQAYVDGAEIEVKHHSSLEWSLIDLPAWNWYDNRYRIRSRVTCFAAYDPKFLIGKKVRRKEAEYYSIVTYITCKGNIYIGQHPEPYTPDEFNKLFVIVD